MARTQEPRVTPYRLLAVLALLLACSAPVLSQSGTQPLIRGGEAPELFLLYTGDVIGYVGPCG